VFPVAPVSPVIPPGPVDPVLPVGPVGKGNKEGGGNVGPMCSGLNEFDNGTLLFFLLKDTVFPPNEKHSTL
jgi:hypothetical protein